MVARFLDVYAAEYRRAGRADHPARYREQFNTISREAILAMVLRVQAALPTRLKVRVSVRSASRTAGRRSKAKKGKKAQRRKRNKQVGTWRFPCSIFSAKSFSWRSARRWIGMRTMRTSSGTTWNYMNSSQPMRRRGEPDAHRELSHPAHLWTASGCCSILR